MASWELELGHIIAPLEHGSGTDETVDIEDEVEEEIEPMKVAKSPYQPTAAEEAEHRIDHANYRDWCPWCVMGRARGAQHRHGGRPAVPIIGIDYFFITKEGLRRKKELIQTGAFKDKAEIERARAG